MSTRAGPLLRLAAARSRTRACVLLLGFWALGAAACERANASHCGNQADPVASCVERFASVGRVYCSVCTADQDGCVATPVASRCAADGALASTGGSSGAALSGASSSSTSAGPSGSDDTAAATTTAAGSSGASDSTGTAPVCGDGMVEGDEHCDGSDLGGASCASLGLGSGDLGCNTQTCNYDFGDCSLMPDCGNGTIEGDEQCDGPNLGGQSCESLPEFAGGRLGCDACRFNTSDCTPCATALTPCTAGSGECCNACNALTHVCL